MTAHVLQANAGRLPLADASVDLVVTSPPYFGLRSYEDGGEHVTEQIGAEATPSEFVAALIECTREMVRVLRPGGSIWVNLGDKYATYAGNRSKGRTSLQGATDRARPVIPRKGGLDGGGEVRWKSLMGIPWRYALACTDDLGLVLRAEVVWSKTNGVPESVRDRARRTHETWFHLVREPRHYANQAVIRPVDHDGRRLLAPPSVREVAMAPLRVPDHLPKHYAAFPPEWPRWIIEGWCPPGGTVLDPFGGTGTTAMVADVMGRVGISADLSHDYSRVARWRVSDPRQRSKVRPSLTPLW